MQSDKFFSRHASGIIQIFIWGLLISTPVLLALGDIANFRQILLSWVLPIGLMAVLFYLTYFLYVPRLLFRRHKAAFFLCSGGSVMALVALALFLILRDAGTLDRRDILAATAIGMLQVVGYSLFVFAAFALRSMQRNQKLERERLIQQEELARMETERLKSQLNPHFIFNTLNNISALVEISPESARDAIARLSLMMRHILEQGGIRFVPLDSEIGFLRDYISLMQLRYTSSLEVRAEFPDESVTRAVSVPPMLFISLVENAFKHGASSRVPSSIGIRMTVDGASLTLDVSNTLLPRKLRSSVPSHGVGITNLCRRLEMLYPGSFTFSCGEREYESLYRATLTIPCNTSL